MRFAVGLLVSLLLNPVHVSGRVRGHILTGGGSSGRVLKGEGKEESSDGGKKGGGMGSSSKANKKASEKIQSKESPKASTNTVSIKPVDFKEGTVPVDSRILDDALTAMRKELNQMNQILLISKEIDDAERKEDKFMRDAKQAEEEEATAKTEAEREEWKKKKVAARLEKQAAFEHACQAREMERALEATRQSAFKAAMTAVEKYNEEVQANTFSKAAQSLEEQTKADKETEKETDKTVWRAKKEAARDMTKKNKEALQNERIAFKEACESLEEACEILIASRMESKHRSELRLSNVVLSQTSADADEAYAVVKQEVTELTQTSQDEAAELKAKSKMVMESQQFYYDRVLSIQEDIASAELAKLEILDANENYQKVWNCGVMLWLKMLPFSP